MLPPNTGGVHVEKPSRRTHCSVGASSVRKYCTIRAEEYWVPSTPQHMAPASTKKMRRLNKHVRSYWVLNIRCRSSWGRKSSGDRQLLTNCMTNLCAENLHLTFKNTNSIAPRFSQFVSLISVSIHDEYVFVESAGGQLVSVDMACVLLFKYLIETFARIDNKVVGLLNCVVYDSYTGPLFTTHQLRLVFVLNGKLILFPCAGSLVSGES